MPDPLALELEAVVNFLLLMLGRELIVLWKGTVRSYTPSHFSSPSYGFLTQFAICGGTNKGLSV